MKQLSGRCLCGEVSFELSPPTLFSAHCHCRYCRLAHGAAFVTWVGVAEQSFRITAGDESLRWYQSSPQSRRGFCTQCGSTMLYTSVLSPGEVHVALPYLDGPIDREPAAHVFFDEHVPWLAVTDKLPRFASDSELLSKYRQVDPAQRSP